MDRSAILRTVAVVIVAGLLAALIAALDRRPQPSSGPAAVSDPRSDDLSTELRRCGALGPQDAEDPQCRSVWKENRRRFFGRPARPANTPAAPASPASGGTEP